MLSGIRSLGGSGWSTMGNGEQSNDKYNKGGVRARLERRVSDGPDGGTRRGAGRRKQVYFYL